MGIILYFPEFPRILSGMDEDIDTFESLSAEFEVQGFGVPRPSVLWLVMKCILFCTYFL